jgi:hypothetical protein
MSWKDILLRDYQPRANGNQPTVKKKFDRRLMTLESEACAEHLQQDRVLLGRLREERGWAAKALRDLGVGTNGREQHMVTLPVFDRDGKLHDVLRYDPFVRSGRKVLAGQGRSRLPWPAPEHLTPNGNPLFIVEGEGTAISLASVGLNAIGLPGSIGRPKGDPLDPGSWRGVGWHSSWTRRFNQHTRVVCMPDCDEQGRALMSAVRYDMDRGGYNVANLDLRAAKEGFDVGDMLRVAQNLDTRREVKQLLLMAAVTARQQPKQTDEAVAVLRAWFLEHYRNGASPV